MLPDFLVEESAVRESGESSILDVRAHSNENLHLTFCITHAVENESIGVDILASKDGLHWPAKPIISFTPKYYCGTYHLLVPIREARYIKAAWRVTRWSRADSRPFFRFYILAEPAEVRAAVAGAA
jgi:hypothetical protein